MYRINSLEDENVVIYKPDFHQLDIPKDDRAPRQVFSGYKYSGPLGSFVVWTRETICDDHEMRTSIIPYKYIREEIKRKVSKLHGVLPTDVNEHFDCAYMIAPEYFLRIG